MRLQMSAVVGTSLLLAACGGGKSSPADSSGDLAPSDTTASDLSDQGGSEELALSDREGSDLHPEVVPVPESFDVPAGGGMTVRVTTAPFGIVGLKGDKVVWDGSESPLAIGVVPKIDPLMRYDPEVIADDVEWIEPGSAQHCTALPDGSWVLDFEPQPGRVVEMTLRPNGEGVVTFDLVPKAGYGYVLYRVRYRSQDKTENFYGLGESFDHVARRGLVRQLFHTLDLTQESGYNEAHFPIPLLISTNGSGIFIEDRHPGFFDVCAADPDRVSATFETGALRFHLLFAPTPLEVLTRYTAVAGKPALPPKWAFGVLQWRDEVSGQAMVMDDAQQMRERDLPCSGLWIDRPWATGHQSFVFDPQMFPDAKQMIKDLNSMGYRVAVWSAPYLDTNVPDAYKTAVENGYFVESPDIQFEKFGKLVDFTNPGLVELWQSLIKNATDIGIEGFKLDYGEDVVTGFQTFKTTFKFYNGEGSDTMHHWYHYFYHKTYRDMLPGDVFELNRAGCFGDQTVTSVCWPGDLDSDFHYHREELHVGGLPAAIVGGLTLSVSGYPFFGSDTGGYRHCRSTKEVLLRWVAQTAVSTTLQFGGSGMNHNPWDFTRYEESDDGKPCVSQYDEETVDIWRQFARLHIRLFPYTYTYAVQASQTGVPVLRPFGMVHPEMNEHPDFEYFFGDSLLMAPIYHGGDKVEALLPTGTWIHWWNRTAHTGPGKLQFDVPLDSSVLLVKQGAIIPLLRASIDTLSPAAVPGVESFANDPGPLICRVFPGSQESTFDVVLGPKLAVTPGEDGYTVTFSSVTPAFDRVLFEVDLANLPAGAKAGSVPAGGDGKSYQAAASKDAVNECAGCYYFDGGDKMLYVSPPAGDGSFTF